MIETNISVVIPTWNRSDFLDRLLKSLKNAREVYKYGKTEVIVVDSSKGTEQKRIQNSCEKYNSNYYEGTESVRQKRNFGINIAQYPLILFIDSDVVVDKEIINKHIETYLDNYDIKLGGLLGYTEFVGEKTFWWKIVELTPFVDAFSFAIKYPHVPWTIGNNVLFKKSILEEIGMFEENLPFKLGGDDLDMSYRVTKAGYMILSCPEAISFHSRDTWNSAKAIHDRVKRWGTMEYYICQRHPELNRHVVPKTSVLEIIGFAILIILGFFLSNKIMIAAFLWVIINIISSYVIDGLNGKFENPFYYVLSKEVQFLYDYYRVKVSIKNGSLSALYKGIIFNNYQIRYRISQDSTRIWILWLSYLIVIIATKYTL